MKWKLPLALVLIITLLVEDTKMQLQSIHKKFKL